MTLAYLYATDGSEHLKIHCYRAAVETVLRKVNCNTLSVANTAQDILATVCLSAWVFHSMVCGGVK